MKNIWIGVGLAFALTLAGCGGSEEKKADTSASSAAPAAGGGTATPDEANGATVTGKVTVDGTAPVMKALDMSANPFCVRAHTTPQKSEEVEAGAGGALKDVFVWIKDGDAVTSKTWQVPTTAVMLDQNGCMYKPHMLGVMAGQNIDIKTSDQTNHNIHPMPSVNQEWNESQAPGSEDKMKSFPRQEVMIPVKCQIHPWMKAYIGVVSHPFFAVTADDGSYTIKGLPPGTYTLEFWQEKYLVHDEPITVAAKDSKTVNYAYKSM
jgi:plastocyanin